VAKFLEKEDSKPKKRNNQTAYLVRAELSSRANLTVVFQKIVCVFKTLLGADAYFCAQ